jgi:hypothetical protein
MSAAQQADRLLRVLLVLMIDRQVIVGKRQDRIISSLEEFHFSTILLDFANFP